MHCGTHGVLKRIPIWSSISEKSDAFSYCDVGRLRQILQCCSVKF